MTEWVDPSRRAVELATDEDIEAQAVRPKLSVLRVANADGTFSYYQQVYISNADVTVSGTVDVTLGGVAADSDTSEDALGVTHAAQVVKLRLGDSGVDGGLVSENNPIPTEDQDIRQLLAEAVCELNSIRLLLEGFAK